VKHSTIILGGGLAGLSCAFHLGKGCEVFEAKDRAGGLLITKRVDGYKFDLTGHLLHLKDPYSRKLIQGLLGGNLVELERNSAIYSKGVYTGYPFQANTYGLPKDVAAECVSGFEAAPGRDPSSKPPGNFRDWVLHHFGEGIAGHFMLPYNSKLWRYPLEEMSVSGIQPFVPIPTVEDVRRGATEEGAKGLGYNARFYYPRRGGIYSLVEAMLGGVRLMSVGQRAVEVDPERGAVRFATGYTEFYDELVSTIPLPELVRIIKGVPDDVREAAEGLRYVSVYDVNLGIRRQDVTPYHWVYFPEPDVPFYRAGCMSNMSADMAPEGGSSLYVEVSHLPGEDMPREELVSSVLEGLRKCGMLRAGEEPEVVDVVDIKYAYVVFDSHMERALPVIKDYLASVGIHAIGRYGAWEYSSMEDALLEGRDTADLVRR